MTMKVKINNNMFDVKTVLTSKDTRNGMMGRKFDGFDGMLFFMKNKTHYFWMKNCLVYLDILYINKNKITKIHHNCKPCFTEECEHYEGNGDMVLELHGGTCKTYDIKEDDEIKLF